MADKKEPRYTEKQYIAGGEDGGWGETDVMYGDKKVMENAPAEYANEMQRELGRAKTMKQVNYPKTETMKTVNKKKGGAVKARGCGCAQRGLTKGKMR